ASGAIIAVKAMYELHRTGGRYALVTMCIGGGQGIAAILERVLGRCGFRARLVEDDARAATSTNDFTHPINLERFRLIVNRSH
ncbi:MAG: hypothetical protein POG74_12755, partial [Acidocella sp.]|nr:hypothetical protein [Acidocella sp.]